jgi:hypothetical protein
VDCGDGLAGNRGKVDVKTLHQAGVILVMAPWDSHQVFGQKVCRKSSNALSRRHRGNTSEVLSQALSDAASAGYPVRRRDVIAFEESRNRLQERERSCGSLSACRLRRSESTMFRAAATKREGETQLESGEGDSFFRVGMRNVHRDHPVLRCRKVSMRLVRKCENGRGFMRHRRINAQVF